MLTALVAALALAQAPIVIAPGPARPVVVVLDGQAITLTTTPLAGPDPMPPTPPTPKPPEPPTPTPVTGVLWVSLIVQDSDPRQAALRTHADVRAVAKPGSVKLQTYTHDDPMLDVVKLTPYVTTNGLPLLVLQDAAGKVLSTTKPTDPASIANEVKRYKP